MLISMPTQSSSHLGVVQAMSSSYGLVTREKFPVSHRTRK